MQISENLDSLNSLINATVAGKPNLEALIKRGSETNCIIFHYPVDYIIQSKLFVCTKN